MSKYLLTILQVIAILASISVTSNGYPSKLSVFEGETYWLVNKTNLLPKLLTSSNLVEQINPNTEKIIFLIHGWLDNRLSGWYFMLSNSILQAHPDWNVIQVDWSIAASVFNYQIAASRVPFVGENVGNFMNEIVERCDITSNKILIIGHSLGAHVAGYAGKTANSSGNTVSRIVGLDPACPVWTGATCDKRLCKSDAQFLSVIHTDVGTNGIPEAIGHADFYPNNGINQPGCFTVHFCNHVRAIMYFDEGIRKPDHFPVCPDNFIDNCDGHKVNMADLFSTEEGVFHLKTNAFPPYSIND